MKEYFLLQYKMTNRKLSEAGLNPAIGYLLGVAGFILISEYAFQKTGFAKYVVLLIALSVLFKMSEINRTEFLKIVFGDIKTRIIRIIGKPDDLHTFCNYIGLSSCRFGINLV